MPARSRWWRDARWALVGSLALALAAAPAARGAIPAILLEPDDDCVVAAWAAEGTEVRFTLKTAAGTLKDQQLVVAQSDGASACFETQMTPGDRLTIKRGGQARTLTVLRLQLTGLARVTDRVSGRVTPDRTVRLRILRCVVGSPVTPDCSVRFNATRAPADGTFVVDTTGDLDIHGGDAVELTMRTGAGDRYRLERFVPYFGVGLDEPGVDVTRPAGATSQFVLRDGPGGATIATATIIGDGSEVFTDGVDEVNVEAGHQVVGDFASDARMVVPVMFTDIDAATDVVKATCFPGGRFRVEVFGDDPAQAAGVTGAGGKVTVDVAARGGDLVSGGDVRLRCDTKAGDIVDTFGQAS